MNKLFQINIVANWGATGRIVEDIGSFAMAYGWDSYIAYGRNVNHSKSHLIKIGNKWDMYWHILQTRLFDRHGLGSKKSTYRLIQVIEQIKPDIIHLHNIHGYYVNYKILFEYLSNQTIPVIWTLHDCWSFTGHCSHFDSVGCDRWITDCFSCPQKNKYPSSWFIDRSKHNYRDKKNAFTSISNLIIVPVSIWLKGFLRNTFLKNYPVQQIYNGIDLSVFYPNDKVVKKYHSYNFQDRFVILAVSSIWTVSKGYEDIKKMYRLLNSECIIIMVGLTKEQLKDIPEGIIGIERTESIHQLGEFYSMADVFINPTYLDTFPTTNLEALACGTPVITYNTGGSVEAVSDDTGLVVEQGNLNELLNAIYTIKRNGKCYYKEACRKRAVTLFDKNERFLEYINLYNLLLGKK